MRPGEGCRRPGRTCARHQDSSPSRYSSRAACRRSRLARRPGRLRPGGRRACRRGRALGLLAGEDPAVGDRADLTSTSSFRPWPPRRRTASCTFESSPCMSSRSSAVIGRIGEPMSLCGRPSGSAGCTPIFCISSSMLRELHEDADRAGERAGVGDDRVAGGGDVVAARRRDVAERGDHGLLLAERARSRRRSPGTARPRRRANRRAARPRDRLVSAKVVERLDDVVALVDLALDPDDGDELAREPAVAELAAVDGRARRARRTARR